MYYRLLEREAFSIFPAETRARLEETLDAVRQFYDGRLGEEGTEKDQEC